MLRFDWPADLTVVDRSLERAAAGAFEAIVLSSPTAVNFFEERAQEHGLLARICASTRFGAVGRATANELAVFGIGVDFPIPSHGGSLELASVLSHDNLAGKHILLLQSQLGLETLTHSLREIGAIPERVTLYVTEGPTLEDAARLVNLLESKARPDAIAFFSPSAVHNFVRTLAEMASGLIRELPPLAAIGETTAKAIEETLHKRPEIVARKADQTSLAQDILHYLEL